MKRLLVLKRKGKPGWIFWSVLLAALFALCSQLQAQELAGYEYEPGEGLHQEEWYDPSDWFDTGTGIDYEGEWDDYYYGYDIYDEWYFGKDLGLEEESDFYSTYDAYDPYDPWDYDPSYYQYYSEGWYEDFFVDEKSE